MVTAVEPPTVLPGPQTDFLLSDARYPAYIGGRGSGKSVASILKAFKYINEHAGPGYAMFTVPTMGDIDKILLPRIRRFFGHLEGAEWVWHEKKAQLFFPNLKWTIWVRPASEPNSCRGPDLAFAAMDEIGTEDQEETFRILQAAVRLPGFPNQLWVTSTPNVVRRWIKQRWLDHVNPLDGTPLPNPHQYPIFRARTIDNPHNPRDWRDDLIAEWGQTRWAKQELEGEFITVEGLAFELSEDAHRRDWPDGKKWIREVTGFDLGGTSPTSLIRWRLDESRRPWAVDEFYKRGATAYDWVQWCRDRGISRLTADPSISDAQILDWRMQFGINIERARPGIKSFPARYQLWSSRLAIKGDGLPGLFIGRNCPNLWSELSNLAFHKPRGHEYANDAWMPGSLDHAYDAGAYGLSAFEGFYGNPAKIPVRFGRW